MIYDGHLSRNSCIILSVYNSIVLSISNKQQNTLKRIMGKGLSFSNKMKRINKVSYCWRVDTIGLRTAGRILKHTYYMR